MKIVELNRNNSILNQYLAEIRDVKLRKECNLLEMSIG